MNQYNNTDNQSTPAKEKDTGPTSPIAEKAYELAIKYEKQCTGCAQTIVAAMFESLGIWSDDVFKSASGLANGLGLTGDGTCAALLGASMVISFIFGREHKDFDEIYKPMKSYGIVKRLHNLYMREYATCRCADVQKGLMGVTWNLWELNEMDDNFREQMIDNCSKLVGNIARMATKLILENGYVPK
jgi:C_GCAxxG_C_C family probable redox protein